MEHLPLDQVSSHTLARLASERGLVAEVTPVSEEAVRPHRRGWKRWLPYFFLALSLFALGGMALGITSLAEDGWSLSDAVQLALMALLVFGVFSQARNMLRPTAAGRWLATRRAGPAATVPPRAVSFVLDAVTAEYLTAVGPAQAARMRRLTALRRAGSRWFDRTAVIAVVVLGVGAFIGMVAVLAWVLYAAGVADPSTWLTAPFTALSGFGAWQLFGSARKMSFRGRPFTLVSRAFRDSVRLWGSGSIATKAALTTTAAASVAGAAVVPVVVDRDTRFDMFLRDSASGAIYRVDLATDISVLAPGRDTGLQPIALTTNSEPVTLQGGRKLPKGSLLIVLEGGAQGGQGVVAFPPSSNTAVQVSRIQPPIPDARYAGGPGTLYAVQPDGAFWHVDLRTGGATRVGDLSIPAGPFTYESDTKSLVMVSEGQVHRLEPASGAVLSSNPTALQDGEEVCAIADGPGDLLFLSIVGQPEIVALHGRSRSISLVRPTGEAPAEPCELAVAYRK